MRLDVLELEQARESDIPLLRSLQEECFLPLYRHYRDHATSPALDTEERIRQKFLRPGARYWFITDRKTRYGVIRIVESPNRRECRVSPLFVRPAWQHRGIAGIALALAERLYPRARVWELETIEEESGLRKLYERAGYRLTGHRETLQDNLHLVGYRKELQED